MDKGLRGRALNMVRDKFEAKLYFKAVETQVPTDPTPNALSLPSVHIARAIENIREHTNVGHETDFPLDIVIFVHAPEDVDIAKSDAEDEALEALMELMIDADFREIVDEILIKTVDPGPRALAPLGYQGGVFPPYGAIRISVSLTFNYQAIDR